MQDLPVLVALAGFSVMGIGAIAKPAFVTAQPGVLELTPAGLRCACFAIDAGQRAGRFLQQQG